MIPIVTPAQMRQIDATADAPVEELIARAGWHVARRARSMLGGIYGRRVVVIAGPGNNGADGRVAADLLRRWGAHVTVVDPDVGSLPAVDLVIDGAYGTGANRPYQAPSVPDGVPILAVDTPSGIDGLTGRPLGVPLAADHTVTFAALKPGLVLDSGATMAGSVEVVDIGLDTSGAGAWLFTESDARAVFPRRAVDDHKWKRALYVIGGSPGMYGAPMLASQAALRAGCGIVWCGLPGQRPPSLVTEVVFRELAAQGWHQPVVADAERFGAVVVGCGLGRSPMVAPSLRALIDDPAIALVIDGDGLRALGERPTLRSNIVLTPHDGEFAALTGHAPRADRFEEVRSLAEATGATVLLKGPLTIVARPDGYCVASATGDQRLATAGTGDVLAGIIGSYLAAGLAPEMAACLGAWVHGEAAALQTPFGMVASDLVGGLVDVAARLLSASPHGDTHASY